MWGSLGDGANVTTFIVVGNDRIGEAAISSFNCISIENFMVFMLMGGNGHI